MKNNKQILFIIVFFITTSSIYGQLGLKGGVNLASEVNSLSQLASDIKSQQFTGYQIGLVYQAMPKKSGLGVEIGALISQKGSTFKIDSINVGDIFNEGYRELNYLEVPLNLRYRLSVGFIGIYGFAGVYGGYALSGNTVSETQNSTTPETFQNFMERVDYGYNFGVGIELFKKIQLGGTISQGIKSTTLSSTSLPQFTTTTNKVLSVNLVYMF